MVTALQRDRLRLDVGDRGDPPAFEDDEIDDLFLQATEAGYTTAGIQSAFVRVRMIERLLGNSTLLTSYTANRSSESLSDVMGHLKTMLDIYKGDLNDLLKAMDGGGVNLAPGRRKPSRLKEWPLA